MLRNGWNAPSVVQGWGTYTCQRHDTCQRHERDGVAASRSKARIAVRIKRKYESKERPQDPQIWRFAAKAAKRPRKPVCMPIGTTVLGVYTCWRRNRRGQLFVRIEIRGLRTARTHSRAHGLTCHAALPCQLPRHLVRAAPRIVHAVVGPSCR